MIEDRDYSDKELIAAFKIDSKIDKAVKFIYPNYYDLPENNVSNNKGSEQDAGYIIQETIMVLLK